jgi:glycosyltransferase involved in cell wall biosynthesis
MRLLWPGEAINKRASDTFEYADVKDIAAWILAGQTRRFYDYDLYVFSRALGPLRDKRALFFLRDLRQKVVLDLDDDLTGQTRDLGQALNMRAATGISDSVICSSVALANLVQDLYGCVTHTAANYLDTGWYGSASMKAERVEPDKCVIGLVGTRTHWGDYRLVVPALMRLKEKFGDMVDIFCGGYCPGYLREILPSARHSPFVPFSEYPTLLRQVDIRLCPLESDQPFNECKSPIAAIEAMAAARPVGEQQGRWPITGGAIPVCSDHPVYRPIVNNDQNGYLVSDADWYDVLESLVADKVKRQTVAKHGSLWIKRNRDKTSNHLAFVRAYKETLRG